MAFTGPIQNVEFSSATSGSTLTFSPTATIPVGTLLVIPWVANGNVGSLSCSDNSSQSGTANSYTQLSGPASVGMCGSTVYCVSSRSILSTDVITLTLTSAQTRRNGRLLTFTGAKGLTPFDLGLNVTPNAGNNPITIGPTSGTLAGTNELSLGISFWLGGAVASGVADSTTGYTLSAAAGSGGAATRVEVNISYKKTAGTAAETDTQSFTSITTAGGMILIFKTATQWTTAAVSNTNASSGSRATIPLTANTRNLVAVSKASVSTGFMAFARANNITAISKNELFLGSDTYLGPTTIMGSGNNSASQVRVPRTRGLKAISFSPGLFSLGGFYLGQGPNLSNLKRTRGLKCISNGISSGRSGTSKVTSSAGISAVSNGASNGRITFNRSRPLAAVAPRTLPGIIIPAYVYPGAPPREVWNAWIRGAPAVKYIIANPGSPGGPGTFTDTNYQAVIAQAQAAGIRILGYVDTSYTVVTQATAKGQVDSWKTLYGINDIFFDQVSSSPADLAYYQSLCDYVHLTGGAQVMLNPGTNPDVGYMSMAELVCTFEGAKTTPPSPDYDSYSPAPYLANYPGKKVHLIYNVADKVTMQTQIDKAITLGADYVYVSDTSIWFAMPSFWNDEIIRLTGASQANLKRSRTTAAISTGSSTGTAFAYRIRPITAVSTGSSSAITLVNRSRLSLYLSIGTSTSHATIFRSRNLFAISTSSSQAIAKPLGNVIIRAYATGGLVPQIVSYQVNPRPMVVFTFDDGPNTDLTVSKPLLDSKGIKGCFCMIVNYLNGGVYLDWQDARDLQAAGHEIISHSLSHIPLAGVSPAVMKAEITDVLDAFKSQGIIPKGFCWPGSSSDAASQAVAAQSYQYALGSLFGTAVNVLPLTTYFLRRAVISNTGTLATYKTYVDSARSGNGLLIYIIHAGYDLDVTQQANLSALMDYVQAGGTEITTMDQALNGTYSGTSSARLIRSRPMVATSNKELYLGDNTYVGPDTNLGLGKNSTAIANLPKVRTLRAISQPGLFSLGGFKLGIGPNTAGISTQTSKIIHAISGRPGLYIGNNTNLSDSTYLDGVSNSSGAVNLVVISTLNTLFPVSRNVSTARASFKRTRKFGATSRGQDLVGTFVIGNDIGEGFNSATTARIGHLHLITAIATGSTTSRTNLVKNQSISATSSNQQNVSKASLTKIRQFGAYSWGALYPGDYPPGTIFPGVGFNSRAVAVLQSNIKIISAVSSGQSGGLAPLARVRATAAITVANSTALASMVRTHAVSAIASGNSSSLATFARIRTLAAVSNSNSTGSAGIMPTRGIMAVSIGTSPATAIEIRARIIPAVSNDTSPSTVNVFILGTHYYVSDGSSTAVATPARVRNLTAVSVGNSVSQTIVSRTRASAAIAIETSTALTTTTRVRAFAAISNNTSSALVTVAHAIGNAVVSTGSSAAKTMISRARGTSAHYDGTSTATVSSITQAHILIAVSASGSHSIVTVALGVAQPTNTVSSGSSAAICNMLISHILAANSNSISTGRASIGTLNFKTFRAVSAGTSRATVKIGNFSQYGTCKLHDKVYYKLIVKDNLRYKLELEDRRERLRLHDK